MGVRNTVLLKTRRFGKSKLFKRRPQRQTVRKSSVGRMEEEERSSEEDMVNMPVKDEEEERSSEEDMVNMPVKSPDITKIWGDQVLNGKHNNNN